MKIIDLLSNTTYCLMRRFLNFFLKCKSWYVCSLQLKHKGLGVKTFFTLSNIAHLVICFDTINIFFKGFFKKGNSLHFEHTKGYFWIPIFLMKNLVLLHFFETLNSLYGFFINWPVTYYNNSAKLFLNIKHSIRLGHRKKMEVHYWYWW